MVRMCNPTYIKVTISKKEAEGIDRAVGMGYGRSRADFCRTAISAYLAELNRENEVSA